jgi:hypothetical protein
MDDADTIKTNTASADRTEISSESRRIFGLPLERALELVNAINVAALWAAAIAGAFIAVTAYFIIKWQGEIQSTKDAAFETYKTGVSAKVAEAKQEGIEAGKTAGNALVRAAGLEKEAADARLETERLKQVVAWRSISPEGASELEKVLAVKPGSVNLRFTDGDPEALFLAIQFSQILSEANWKIGMGASKLPNAILFGIAIPDAPGDDVQTLRGALASARISFSSDATGDRAFKHNDCGRPYVDGRIKSATPTAVVHQVHGMGAASMCCTKNHTR